jgi:hypothetical protein
MLITQYPLDLRKCLQLILKIFLYYEELLLEIVAQAIAVNH